MKSFRMLLSSSLLLLPLACGVPESTKPTQPAVTAPGEVVGSNKSRIVAAAQTADLKSAVVAQNELALALHRRLQSDSKGNLFFSPYSINTALSMTYAGAANETAKAFEKTLNIQLSSSAHHRAINTLDRELTSRGQNAQGADGQPFRLTTTNQVFSQNGFSLETPFLDTLAQEYGSNIRLLDFKNSAEPSRLAINEWVEQKTEKRIQELLPEGSILPVTRLVLVNAIYFNAAWSSPFDSGSTKVEDFFLDNGSKVSVPTMNTSGLQTRSGSVDGVEVVELPYDGNELSMILLMPAAGQLQAFETALTLSKWDAYLNALQSGSLTLSLPKFEMTVSNSLKQPLTDLGLGRAFTEGADFSGMSKEAPLSISEVVHKAFVKVNERGTEAAASTAVIVGKTSFPTNVRTVRVDHPFVFAIRDNATGAIVFLGRVAQP